MSTRYGRSRRGKKKFQIMVKAPELLGGMDLYYILATDPDLIKGRRIEVLLSDLTGDFNHQFIKVKLKITEVKDSYAYTVYDGHEYFREYERSFIMRGTSYVKAIKDIETKDGYKFRVRVGVFTAKRINNSRKKGIRRYVFDVLDKWAKKTDHQTFIRDILFGKLDEEIKKVARKVYPIRDGTGIYKVKVLKRKEE
ncbi:TPA: 30S ribosomal protein S3ae [Candidatus Geothermarchaeota archaeon]|nr:30S ribosomal protein S3ae [Candidatus Geothermarchaeota archaeon]